MTIYGTGLLILGEVSFTRVINNLELIVNPQLIGRLKARTIYLSIMVYMDIEQPASQLTIG